MGSKWRFLKATLDDPVLNLALEWALLKSVGSGLAPSTIRLWVNQPCVVIDRSALSLAEVRLDICSRLGLPVLKRPTAGGAVYHDEGNLNWTVVARRKDLPNVRWPSELEKLVSRALGALLADLGLEGHLRPMEGFFVRGLKVSGMAFYLGRSVLMAHGTLLVNSDLATLRSVLTCKFEVANLSALTGLELDPWSLAPELAARLSEVLGQPEVAEGRLLPAERDLAEDMGDLVLVRHGP